MTLGPGKRPLVVGHRGARGLYPENTLAGFARAVALGVDAVELDVAITADGVVVVIHDPRLNPDIVRGADGKWLDPPTPLLRDLTFDQLRAYDIGRLRPGSAYAAAFPAQQPVDGARVPSLAEAIAATGQVPLLIEMKTFPDEPELAIGPDRMAESVVAAIQAGDALRRRLILSFDWRGLRYLRQRHPGIATGWLTQAMDEAQRRLWWAQPPGPGQNLSAAAVVAQQGGRCWLPEWAELRQPDLAAAQQLGLSVVPWGVDGPQEIGIAAEWGVDGLITDRPDLALQIIRDRRRRDLEPIGRRS